MLSTNKTPPRRRELVAEELLAYCKRVCRREVDEALEAYGKRPRWFAGQRYQVVQAYRKGVMLIIPNEVELDAEQHRWTHVFGVERGLCPVSGMGGAPIGGVYTGEMVWTQGDHLFLGYVFGTC